MVISDFDKTHFQKKHGTVHKFYFILNTNPITNDGETLEDVEPFTYLGSIINERGGSGADVVARISKARTTFLQLKNIWNSKQMLTTIKVGIFNTNVKTVYCTELKLRELLQPSSRGHKHL
ncbi:unnamed protein product [Schistosoma bovis]|nr:unnamed protein product [Schistosoma bovis]